ncbi:glycogen debranching protein GlgX [Nostocoides sp. F2B08]|uniref:glycogen debranching protein GlgX n=1 Tax=Nostocoides sp. F2B08 TaxID=2653936 RepID=UPI003519FF43
MTLRDGGADVSVYAGHADGIDLCLFEPGDLTGESERRIPLPERAHGWWWGFVEGLGAGQRYALRARGPWAPDLGLRYNENKLLLDPYARGIEGAVRLGPESYAHKVRRSDWRGDGQIPSALDSAAHMPRGVVLDNGFDWGEDRPPGTPLTETVVYETHVKNLTMRHPAVPAELRGTYAGLAHPAVIEHLQRLGVTAVELLPVQASTSEAHLVQRGLTNHWGYNTLGFFAPHAAYASTTDPGGVLAEFKGMVKLLHAAGIEVILDVVYNHTCEGDSHGPTYSWRGLDNRAYYRLDDRGADVDFTGCGNSLNLRHPIVAQMVLDSLRYWVTECHVDGFRFDLAVTLGRGRTSEYDPDHPFLVALRVDPVLSRVKLVAEPWDVGPGGWRTGQFPPPFVEWNDRFRDSVRTFWLSDVRAAQHGHTGHGVRDLATRLAGSQDLFAARDRGPLASVNFVTAHDGFTLADLTAYNRKHNGANGEGNRDGTDDNRSYNHGREGWADASASILRDRRRSMRNLMATLLLANGVPMLNAGDELGRTQWGNNNPYCLDIEEMWVDWDLEPWREDLLETARFLTGLRRRHPVLRQRTFHTGQPVSADGSLDVAWYGTDGAELDTRAWESAATHTLQMLLDGAWLDTDSLLIVLHGGGRASSVNLPKAPGLLGYSLLWDSTWEHPSEGADSPAAQGAPLLPGTPVTVEAASLRVYRAQDPT